MDSKKIQMPREVHIGSGVINRTGNICKDLRIEGDVLVVTGNETLKIGAEPAIESLESSDYQTNLIQIDEASESAVKKVEEAIGDDFDEKSRNVSVVLGVGGGKVIDVAKIASTNKDIYFISVPTAASHDGIASPLASIKNKNGSTSLEAQSPIGVIADTNIIRKAPFRLMASGCADIVSNCTAIKDWKLAQRLQNENYSESAAALSSMTAKLIIKSSNSIKEGLEESARLVVKSLFSSGMAISIAGSSRPASGSEHKFSHALDKITKNRSDYKSKANSKANSKDNSKLNSKSKPKSKSGLKSKSKSRSKSESKAKSSYKSALHGEQCGVGTIMMMNLHGGDWKCIRDALKAMNAPTNAYELNIDPEDIIDALTLAHTIRPERYTILGDRGLSREAAKKLAIRTEVI